MLSGTWTPTVKSKNDRRDELTGAKLSGSENATLTHDSLTMVHADISALNLLKLNQISIVISFFRLIWQQMKFRLVPKREITIQIWFNLTRFRKDLSVC